jgi:uncharacterized protein
MDRTETKFATTSVDTATGIFEGYGAVFANLDSHRDIIVRGAFQSSLAAWRTKGRLPAMKLQHGSSVYPFSSLVDDLPIGKFLEMREDSHGLFLRGQLIPIDTDLGRRLLSLMSAGVLDGLSIGYRVKRSTPGRGDVKRYLEELTTIWGFTRRRIQLGGRKFASRRKGHRQWPGCHHRQAQRDGRRRRTRREDCL